MTMLRFGKSREGPTTVWVDEANEQAAAASNTGDNRTLCRHYKLSVEAAMCMRRSRETN